jgi:DNA-binding FadR family transcriptional regulator
MDVRRQAVDLTADEPQIPYVAFYLEAVNVWFIVLLQKVLAKGQLTHARNERLHLLTQEHGRIVDAIEARDPDAARERMLAHLTISKCYSDQEIGIELQVISPGR